MKYYNFFVLIKKKRKKKRIIKDKVKMERQRDREIEMNIERRVIFATNASQTKESKIVAIAKPKRV